ncbi:restriction endonuclease subunit S [Streptococcus sanguinis]|uniref:restriction endonuclease subunit S n=1 Tax=Streptococcus sanguinis TaxID=1305 RepID=UPI0002DA0678|nr:restriction endonuclease subunit S [Streptococcus sanguinis]MBZ2053648.1 restriction endonuclease subunit S [Streptococcus sanguinis]MCY7032605.1 restriction endonuclease subunit S [Streptococcus sanguinis]
MKLSDWKEYRIGELIETIFSGGTPNTKNSDYWNGSLPWLSSGETRNRYINVTEKTITNSGAQNSSTRQALKGDVVMASAGQGYTRGQVSFLNIDTFINQSVIAIRANEKVLDKKFLFYNLSSRYEELRAISDSNSIRGSITTKMVKSMNIRIPDLNTQRAIANVLSSIDDKIETSKQINHHLEQMAQAIFKSWFVDFEPFGGKMPNDWTIGKLSDVLKLIKNGINDKDKQKLPYVPIDILPMHSLSLNSYKSNDEAKSSLITFKKNDILLGAMRVYFHRVCISPFTGITRSTCFVLRPFNKIYLEYCLLTCDLKSSIEYAQSTSKGSTMPYAVWENGLAELKIPIPTEKVIKNFSKIVSPLIKTLQDSIYEIENLQNLRDTLLPKLLSGEISVNQATK